MKDPNASDAKGFTLVETLVALLLVSAVAMPVSFWFYRSHSNHAALARFYALQGLETRMHRAVLLRLNRDWSETITTSTGFRYEIDVSEYAGETRLKGVARDRKGKVLVTLETVVFERDRP